MLTAVFASLLTIAAMFLLIRYWEKKRQKEIERDMERHKREMIDMLLDDFERKIS